MSNVCFQTSLFNPEPDAASPVSYTVTVRRPAQADQVFMGSYTSVMISATCAPGQPGYLTSITYP